MKRTICWMVALLLVCPLLGCEAKGKGDSGKLKIAVIPKGNTHAFWKSVQAGAEEAAREQGVDIVFKGPLVENDRAQQIELVEQFVSDGVSGIVLAPLDDTALVRPVRSAMKRDVPVVIIDSGLKAKAGEDYICFAATDNFEGGRLGGERLAKLLGNQGKVVLLRYEVGSASTDQREAGFMKAMEAHPQIEIISDNQYAGATMDSALAKAEQMLDQLQMADGVFCPNESSTHGMLIALRKHNLVGSLHFVGFDASPELVAALEKKEIAALVVQNPRRMGYEGVTNMVKHLKSEAIENQIDTGVAVISAADLAKPEVQELIR